MELKDAILGRRSIRGFLEKPVPEPLIKETLQEALWAPSWGNTQPWGVTVATGAPLQQFKEAHTEAFLSGKNPDPDIPIPIPEAWPGPMSERYTDVGRRVLESLCINRDDQGGRIAYYARMYSLFDAPALVLITVEKGLPLAYAMLDVGLFLQTFCLSAHGRGLGVCILGAAILYSGIVRRFLAIPESRTIAIGAALGWPDPTAPVNRFSRKRDPLDSFIEWVK